MSKKRKAIIIIIAVITAAVGISAALIIHNNKSNETRLSDITLSNGTLPTHPLQQLESFETELTSPQETDDAVNIDNVKNQWWYLYDDESVTCYAFYFSDNSRTDIAYFDESVLNGESYKSGYSVYNQDGSDIILKHLPDAFPIKDFTLRVKDDRLYSNDMPLEKGDKPSNDKFISYYR